MDTIIHMAAYPNPADFIDVLLEPEIYTVCTIYAMRRTNLA